MAIDLQALLAMLLQQAMPQNTGGVTGGLQAPYYSSLLAAPYGGGNSVASYAPQLGGFIAGDVWRNPYDNIVPLQQGMAALRQGTQAQLPYAQQILQNRGSTPNKGGSTPNPQNIKPAPGLAQVTDAQYWQRRPAEDAAIAASPVTSGGTYLIKNGLANPADLGLNANGNIDPELMKKFRLDYSGVPTYSITQDYGRYKGTKDTVPMGAFQGTPLPPTLENMGPRTETVTLPWLMHLKAAGIPISNVQLTSGDPQAWLNKNRSVIERNPASGQGWWDKMALGMMGNKSGNNGGN